MLKPMIAALGALLLSTAHPAWAATPEDGRFERLVDQAYRADLAADPTRRTLLTITKSEAAWTPTTDAWRAAKAKRSADRLAALPKAIDRAKLSPDHQIQYDIYESVLKDDLVTQKVLLEGYTSGANVWDPSWDLPQTMTRFQKLETAQDARNYIARLAGLPQVLTDILAAGEARRERGVTLMQTGYTALAAQTRAFSQGAPCGGPGEHTLIRDFKAKLAASTVAAAQRPALIAQAEATLKAKVCPAYARFADAVAAMAPSGRTSGMWQMPGGAENYRDFVEFTLADRVDPEVLHETGLKAVDEIEGELRAMATKMGFADLAALRADLQANPKLSVPTTDAGYAELEAITKAHLAAVQARLPDYFAYIPKTPLVVERALKGPLGGPPSADSFYTEATADGSMPAIYNLAFPPGPPRTDVWSMTTTTFHEGVPGHHLQTATAAELRTGPAIPRRFLVGYADGWAMYAEQLAVEMGLYEGDDYGRIGWIDARLERAVRLVIDTGLNAKGWTPEQATAYQKAHLVGNAGVGRFLNWPGQAVGYYWGYSEMLRLREKARAELGDRFDIKGFHDAVLRHGSMPAAVMRRSVDNWIASVKAQPPIAKP